MGEALRGGKAPPCRGERCAVAEGAGLLRGDSAVEGEQTLGSALPRGATKTFI